MAAFLTKEAATRLRKIHRLSKRYNGPSQKTHLEKLLSLAQKHVDEISMLQKKGDAHYLVEVGDLLILCLEILLENKKNVDAVAGQCFDRYERKLNCLISGV